MPAQLTTKAQVNGYRFLLRRLDHALVRRDVRMLHDPMRVQFRSLMVGLVLGILMLAGCAIYGLIRPQGQVGDAKIIAGRDSGALYVRVDDRLHPALNLASARLITGSNEKPKAVKDAKLGQFPRGTVLGIPGAPQALPASSSATSAWAVCETTALSPSGSAAGAVGVVTTVIAAEPRLGAGSNALGSDAAMLVKHQDRTYLLYDGKRAPVDLNNPVIARSLKASAPRPVGTGILAATVEQPPLASPVIARAGELPPFQIGGAKIGSVIKVSGVDAAELYVVLADGIQRITPFTATVLRNADSQGQSDIVAVPPSATTGVPVVNSLAVRHFPNEVSRLVSAEEAPVACLSWMRGTADRAASVRLLGGSSLPLASSAKAVPQVTADGNGDRVDATYIPPTSGEFVQITGIEPDSERREALVYVADNGVRYAIPDVASAVMLGLNKPKLAPWSIVGLLVPGPELSRPNALVSHDTLAPDPKSGAIAGPK